MGRGALATSFAGGAGALLQACSTLPKPNPNAIVPETAFRALEPSSEDRFRLAQGLDYRFVAIYGDELNTKGLRFGYNNDYIAFFPLDGKPGEGLLCVNNEFPHAVFVGGWDGKGPRTKEHFDREMDSVGVSILHVREEGKGNWKLVKNSKYNRRITGKTKIPFVSARPIEGAKDAVGTLGNCAGGFTPWGTYLTCEENYDIFYGEHRYGADDRRQFHSFKDAFNWFEAYPYPPEHYGWVVEIHPKTGAAKKLTGLGRVAHECATLRLARDGRAVVYTGDDSADQHLYKFIADKAGSLERGRLYVADLEAKRWIPLVWSENPKFRERFKDQTELLIRTRDAAKMVGATPLDRPEDIEICPRTGAVFITLTNNVKRGNLFGSILKLEEKDNDPLALEFAHSTFLAGGSDTGFACPDNLVFDKKGNLWMTTDMSGGAMNKGPYAKFKNNGLFFIPMDGPNAGTPFLVATGPVDAELTGPCFSPDGRTLFLSVQHPGEETRSREKITSHWPHGGAHDPRPAVVAISGPLLDTIMA